MTQEESKTLIMVFNKETKVKKQIPKFLEQQYVENGWKVIVVANIGGKSDGD